MLAVYTTTSNMSETYFRNSLNPGLTIKKIYMSSSFTVN